MACKWAVSGFCGAFRKRGTQAGYDAHPAGGLEEITHPHRLRLWNVSPAERGRSGPVVAVPMPAYIRFPVLESKGRGGEFPSPQLEVSPYIGIA